ncbi:MAG: Ig-like domain-containing protein [Janthinobacterium lividum]
MESSVDEHGERGVQVRDLPPDLLAVVGRLSDSAWRALLRVQVMPRAAAGDDIPCISGRHEAIADGIRFVPHFPFERGVRYRVTFDPEPLGHYGEGQTLTAEFIEPEDRSAPAPDVTGIFPASDLLPENILRFYVAFSRPMRRGEVRPAVALTDAEGTPVEDALYRAPLELWDPGMRRLTVLLDPGRLKRGVGPNRALGPPLADGVEYVLAIGTKLTAIDGQQLSRTVFKRFRTSAAVRSPLAVEDWTLAVPIAASLDPITIAFPHPMDRALLAAGIGVVRADGEPVGGQVSIAPDDRTWRFAPSSCWSSGTYRLALAPSLEDVCGNGLTGAFDRPLRPGIELTAECAVPSLTFDIR